MTDIDKCVCVCVRERERERERERKILKVQHIVTPRAHAQQGVK